MLKRILILLSLACPLVFAQGTRPVELLWTLSASTQVTGYTISTAAASTGPWTQIGCTGTVAGSTCTGTSATATFTDPSETIGATVFYELIAIAPACVSGGTTACGSSAPATASILVPPKPGTVVVTIIPQ